MKKILFILAVLGFAGNVCAQKPITFTDDIQTFGNSAIPGIWVGIPETSAEVIQKNWTKAIQKGSKSKPITNGQFVSIFGALISDIYEGPINIESIVKSQDTMVMLFTGIELTRGEFAAPGSTKYDKLKKYLKDFAKNEYVQVVEKQLSGEEKKLKKIEKSLSSSRKANERFEKKIQSAQSSIARENDNIVAYSKQLEVKSMAIDNASTRLSYTNDPEAQKASKAEMKSAQKEKKSLLKKIASAENKISRLNNTISDASSSISANRNSQQDIGIEINGQKMIVNECSKKLDVIKSW
jgi:predicted  nucleic acid-binding Zn-ribbon protein